MNNNILTIKKNITLRYIVTGCAWLLYGILALIPNTISKIISIVIKKTENDDEMSRFHFSRACEISILITLIVVLLSDMICSIITVFHSNFVLSYQTMTPFLLATIQICIGAFFYYFEKEGD